jgi:hypothetical protein
MMHSLIETCQQCRSRWLQSADCHNTIFIACCFSFLLHLHHSSMQSMTAIRSLLRQSSLHVRAGAVFHASFSFATSQRRTGKRAGFDQQRNSKADG